MDNPEAQAALLALATEALGCTRCPLHLLGTRTVFGEGPAGAAIVLVGEQPGDQEDRPADAASLGHPAHAGRRGAGRGTGRPGGGSQARGPDCRQKSIKQGCFF